MRDGSVLLVHSSLSSLGFVAGGPITVIETLLEVIGSSGTLVFPSHNWFAVNQGERKYDVRFTPSCVGAISEAFRRWPGVVRSLHPTHAVAAIGPRAEMLTRNHEVATTPCGAETPYARMLDIDGDILFLGVDLAANTAFHTIEALCDVGYLLQEGMSRFEIINADGQSRSLDVRCHAQHIPRRFAEFSQPLRDAGALAIGPVGSANAMLLHGPRFLEVMRRAVSQCHTLLLQGNQPIARLCD